MQETANVSLSAFEQQLVTDASWILTKNRIIEKVFVLFGQLSEQYKQEPFLQQLSPEISKASPKISKGENYEGLPYVMLDYPRCFSREDVFAVRTFFWWGHFFSITLQLKGIYLQQYAAVIQDKIKSKAYEYAWINTSDEEWNHHFRSDNMMPVKEHTNNLTDKKVLKLAFQCKLEEWNNAETVLAESFRLLMQLLQKP